MSMPFNVEKGTRLDAIVIGANRQATKMIPGLSFIDHCNNVHSTTVL